MPQRSSALRVIPRPGPGGSNKIGKPGRRDLLTVQARLRVTQSGLERLLQRTGSASDFILSSVDGRTTVRVGLEVTSVPAARQVIGRRRVTLDWTRATISRGGNRATLTRQELRLLAALVDASPEPARRDQLIRRLWPATRRTRSDGEMALAVAVYALRKRFAAIGVPDAIATVRRIGYQLTL